MTDQEKPPLRPWALGERMEVFVNLMVHRPGITKQQINDTIAHAQQGCSAQDYITFLKESSESGKVVSGTWQDDALETKNTPTTKGRGRK